MSRVYYFNILYIMAKLDFPLKGAVARKLLACWMLALSGPAGLRAQLNVYFVSVGQGDAIYIEFPNGKNALIDGGPSAAPIYNFLKAKSVSAIDFLALTHPHSDHYRGIKKVFSEFEVRNFYDTRAENIDAVGDNNLRELAAAEPGCASHFPEPGQQLRWDPKVTVKVLNACFKPVQIRDNVETNNCSLVLRLYYNGNAIMLTGDAESSIEADMMRFFKSGLRADILKVGHHGSRYSSTEKFLARVQPKYAFISAGPDNVYGHPHKETLDRLTAAGARIFLTTEGTQSFTIPAPGKNAQFPAEPVFNQPFMTAELKSEEMLVTLDYAGPGGADSQALDQLRALSALGPAAGGFFPARVELYEPSAERGTNIFRRAKTFFSRHVKNVFHGDSGIVRPHQADDDRTIAGLPQ